MTGQTWSNFFLALNATHQNTYAGDFDAFLAKFDSTGSKQWATYYGGVDRENSGECTTDSLGNIYIVGVTESLSGIASNGFQNTHGGGKYDAFIVKFNANGVRQWGSYYGGSNDDFGNAVLIDSNGDLYLAGETESATNIATLGSFQYNFGGQGSLNGDGFIAKFSSNGVRKWGSYFGGADDDVVYDCTTSPSNDLYFAGYTKSDSNLISGGFQTTYGGNGDAFLTKITPVDPGFSIDSIISCTPYTWIDGNTYSSSNDSAIYIFPNGAANGADSIVTLNLVSNYAITDIHTACDSFVWFDGNILLLVIIPLLTSFGAIRFYLVK